MIPASLLINVKTPYKSIGKISIAELTVSTDSRTFNKENCFICLSGPNFDGFSYVEQVLEKGCKVVIANDKNARTKECEELLKKYPGSSFLLVSNTISFFQELATLRIKQWKELKGNKKVIGITGSNGKTTTKEMLAGILTDQFKDKILFTLGNLNNHIGVPLTISKLRNDHDIAIIEMGTNHFGEIQVLCEIADPDYGIITTIGESHLEFLLDKDGVLKEKRALADWVLTKGKNKFIINEDDEYLSKLKNDFNSEQLICYGLNSNEIKWSEESKNLKLDFLKNQKQYSLKNESVVGKHNFHNLTLCLVLCNLIFPEKMDEMVSAASKVKLPENNRSNWIDAFGKKVFLDAYNANPSSMKAALEYFIDECDVSKSLFILGDMNELGKSAPGFHQEIGAFIKQKGVTNPVFIGLYGEYYKKGFGAECSVFTEVSELKSSSHLENNSLKFIFIKGSRSLQLESLIDIR